MTTYARLVQAGDKWDGREVERVERYERAAPVLHFRERVVLHFTDGSKSDEWAEARLNIDRRLR